MYVAQIFPLCNTVMTTTDKNVRTETYFFGNHLFSLSPWDKLDVGTQLNTHKPHTQSMETILYDMSFTSKSPTSTYVCTCKCTRATSHVKYC